MSLYSIGEALIDFLPHKNGYIPVVGGAPANVAACYSLLGKEAYFIGMTGYDLFGDIIETQLQALGVKTDYFFRTEKANTALSFVTLSKNGEREFTFYRNPSADMFLNKENIQNIDFNSDDILHFGSVDLLDMPVKQATVFAIEKMKQITGTISFDPNVRKNLWKDWNEYKKVINQFLPLADIIKISKDECDFIFGAKDIRKIADSLLKTAKIVLITLGEEGSYCFTKQQELYQKAYSVKAIDTTGAGDSFIGTFLNFADINDITTFAPSLQKAAAAAAIVCSKKGVFDSLPNPDNLNKFIESYK